MKVLKEYKAILLAGLAVVLFFAAAYFVMGNVEPKGKFTYGAHLFQEDTVSEINIEIEEADWQKLLENPLAEEYYRADVTINGELMGNTAIRTKGNTSLTSVANSESDRYSFKLDFDYYDNNGNYHGLRKLCLNNNYADNSNMREYICYQIMADMGLPVPQCGYSHITVNGEEWGLYLAVEAVDEVFLQTRFADATGDLYKPEGMGGTGADLVYRGDDISVYTNLNLKTNLESSDGSEIIALMKALESGEGLEEVLDLENALKYIAANVALANFDSYLGGTTHNYYLYEENGVFSVIPWDLNLAFGGFGGSKVDIYEPGGGFGMGGPGGKGGAGAERTEETEKISEGTEKQQKGVQKQKPAMGEKPAFEGEAPDFGREMPAFEGKAPNFGGEMPAFDGKAPDFGGEKPALNGEAPDFGGEMPAFDGEAPDFGGGMPAFGGSDGKPLVDTLLANETYLAMYEGYLQEMTDTYLTEAYMAEKVTEIHDLIAPYVKQDATAFYSYEEFEQGCSVDPEDPYSLVYYAVNMAESIRTQIAGGEPTFDTGSMQGGGMFMGGKGPDFGGEMSDFGGEMPAFGGEMPAFDREAPDFGGEMPAFGGGKPPFDREMPDFAGGKPGMPGERGKQPVEIREVLPKMAACGGIFAAGLIVAVFYKRKKDLK